MERSLSQCMHTFFMLDIQLFEIEYKKEIHL